MNKFTPAIFIFLSLLIFLSLDSRLSLTGDNALYIILARSIASGRGYRNLSHPGEPQHVTNPPVLPLFLSPIIRISRSNLWAMKIEIALLGITSLIAIYLLFRELTNPPMALLITLLSGTSTLFLIYTNRIMSEIPYLLFSTLAVFLFLKAVREKQRAIYLLLGIIFVTISYFTRTIGFMLFLASLPVFCQTRHKFAKAKKLSILLLIFLLPFAFWTIRSVLSEAPDEPAYLAQFFAADGYDRAYSGLITTQGLARRILRNISVDLQSAIAEISSFVPALVARGFPSARIIKVVYGIAIGGLIFTGYVLASFRRRTILEYYVPLYFLMLFLWPRAYSRFILPVLPFLYFYLISGGAWTMKLIQRGQGKKAISKTVYVLIGLLLLFNLIWAGKNIYEVRRGKELPPGWKDYKACGLWLKENAPHDVVIACRKPYLMHFFCDRKTVRIPFTQDAGLMLKTLTGSLSPKTKPATHVIYDDLHLGTEKWLEPFYERFGHLLTVVHQVGKTQVWKIRLSIEGEDL